MDLQFITIEPSAPHSHTVIFLHGRGDTARTFAESLRYSQTSGSLSLFECFPSFRWVFPQSQLRDCVSTGEKRSQWFDIWNVTNFSEREQHQATGLKESVPGIQRILAREAALLGGRWDHVVLAGISQGAATGVHTLLNLSVPPAMQGQQPPRRLGAFLGFSCRMPFPGRTLADTRSILFLNGAPKGNDNVLLQNTPILLEHCVDDPLVLVGNGRGLRDSLRGFGAQVTWKEYPNGGHWFNAPTGIDEAVEFLNQHVLGRHSAGQSPSSQVQVSSDIIDLS